MLRERPDDQFEDEVAVHLVFADDAVRVGRAGLRASSRPHVRHRLLRLVSFRRMVDEDERASNLLREAVEHVVDVRYCPVVVLHRPSRKCPVERIHDDYAIALGLEVGDAVADLLDGLPFAAKMPEVEVVLDLAVGDLGCLQDELQAVHRRLPVQLVVDVQHFLRCAGVAQPLASRRNAEREMQGEPRLASLRGGDEVHDLALSENAVDYHGFQRHFEVVEVGYRHRPVVLLLRTSDGSRLQV